MKFLKANGTIEEGDRWLTDEQVEEMQRMEELLHKTFCKYAAHYEYQGIAPCRKIAIEVTLGSSLLRVLEDMQSKPIPVPEPDPADVATEKVEETF